MNTNSLIKAILDSFETVQEKENQTKDTHIAWKTT